MLKPLVSIIVPTFNRAYLIGETLDSVLSQTYQNWECIVVDDGSTDDTEEQLNLYVAKDSRFQYHKRPETHLAGGNGARNYGFTLSKGEFVQWFDSDDIMYPKYLEERLDVFGSYPDTDVVFSAFTYFDNHGLRKRISNNVFTGNIINDLINKKVTFSPLSYLLKRHIIDKIIFDENLLRAQDLDFFFKLFSSSNTIVVRHVKTVLFKVRKHENSITIANDVSGSRLYSKYVVNKRILDYFVTERNPSAIIKYKQECLVHLKSLLDNKHYKLVTVSLLKFKHISYSQKTFLLFCVLTQYFLGIGSHQFKRLKME